MDTFKFFQKEKEPKNYIDVGNIRFNVGERNLALLHNEQLIHYYSNDESILTASVIAWSEEFHRWNIQWTFSRFTGTMEEFLTNRTEIPVIKYIERYGTMLYNGNNRPIDCNLQGVYDIYYYKYHEYENV